MTDAEAVDALGALAHDHRLAAFRLLVREGPRGLSAGALARALAVAPSALSFHLSTLERAGLVTARRAGRNVNYAVAVEAVRGLIGFLTEDCCRGRPELCGAATAAAAGQGRGGGPCDTI